MSPRARLPIVALTLVGLVACGHDRPDPATHAEEMMSLATPRARRVGVVQLVHSEGHKGSSSGRLLVNAAFVGADGLDRQAVARVLGLPIIPDAAEFEAAQCVVTTSSVASAMAEAGGTPALELLDAGDVTLRVGTESIAVPSQFFPDVVSSIAGVTYEATVRDRRALPTLAPRGGRATVAASGSLDVGGFEVSVQVPSRLRIVEVGGRAVRQGVVLAELSGDMTLTWEPPSRDSDLLVVEVARQGFDSVTSIRCLAPDTGSFTVSADLLARLPAPTPDSTDRLAVRRVMLQSFEAPGVDEALAAYVTEDAILLR